MLTEIAGRFLTRKYSLQDFQRQLDLLLHPRLPPLVWSLPLAEKLSLVFSDESHEEGVLRRSLGLYRDQAELHRDADVDMNDSEPNPTADPPFAVPVPKETTSNIEFSALSTSSVPPPETARGEASGEEQLKQTSKDAQEAAKISNANTVHPTTTEPLRAQVSDKASAPTQKVSAYRIQPPAEDEDEDIPAIDMNSDSDFE